MKKFSLATLAALIALTGAANAQTGFDLNAMPLGEFPTAVDKTSTGSVGEKLQSRVITRDGVAVTQFFTVDVNGEETIVSEKTN
ncbi:MAG: hypothetical protein ACRCU5_14615 [Rhizobiaceae bacterium]